MERDQYQQWLWDRTGERAVEALGRHGFEACLVADRGEARERVLKIAEAHRSFGFGGSYTARQLGLPEALAARGKVVCDHWEPGLSPDEDRARRLAQGRCDCFVCSANAVAATGELVNIDGVGNRVSAMTFGPRQVVIVAGMNKVTPDLPSALKRAQEIAGPLRAKSQGLKTPCALTGVCSDCQSPERICRITTIVTRRPFQTAVTVILIKEALGF